MKKEQGFTLIELIIVIVIVIVILGILAVTAAPKFMNLQGDARNSSLQSLKGAILNAAGIVYGKAAIEGKENLKSINVDGINISFGYPTAAKEGIVKAISGVDSKDWSIHNIKVAMDGYLDHLTDGLLFTFNYYNASSIKHVLFTNNKTITMPHNNIIPKNCFLVYLPATAQDKPAQVIMPKGACKS